MNTNFMREKSALAMHLSDIPPSGGMKITSGFVKALKEARDVAGRKPETGEKIPNRSHASWLAAIGYMTLLDQIGSCFKPKSAPEEAGNSISKALKYFSTLNSREIDALYALRCAFAHDYSLYNINQRKSSLTHCFKVFGNSSDPVVSLPNVAWDGNYQNRNNNHTLINLEAFGDLVESICIKLFDLANSDQLEVVLPGGSDELLQRYAFFQMVNG